MKSPVSRCRAVAGPAPRPVSLTTSPGGDYFADLGADDLAGDHNLHAAILLPALRGVVRSHRLSLAETLRSDRTYRHSLLHQVIAHGRAALFGKLLIILITADAVRVTFYVQRSEEHTSELQSL